MILVLKKKKKKPLRSIWLGRRKSKMIKNCDGLKSWEDRRDFSFPYLGLVGR